LGVFPRNRGWATGCLRATVIAMDTKKRRVVWDEDKALVNERKHGIAFKSAASVFKDPLRETFYDREHADSEERWVVVGMMKSGLLAVVICVFEDLEEGEYLRIISARRATSHERRDYESGDYCIREPEMTNEYNIKPVVYPSADDDYDDGMKDEYDFSNAVRGAFKHWRLPIYIDNEVLGYFHTREAKLGIDSTEAINEILRVHVGLPAKRAEPRESGLIPESVRRHFGLPPTSPRPSRTPGAGAGMDADDAERR